MTTSNEDSGSSRARIVPADIEGIPVCQELLDRARKRKHPSLKFHEYQELQVLYRNAHWSPDVAPTNFFGRWAYSLAINDVADPALEKHLQQQGITVLPKEPVEPLHDYLVKNVSGIEKIGLVEKKVSLAKKLRDRHPQE